jgi:hypothetical protein
MALRGSFGSGFLVLIANQLKSLNKRCSVTLGSFGNAFSVAFCFLEKKKKKKKKTQKKKKKKKLLHLCKIKTKNKKKKKKKKSF